MTLPLATRCARLQAKQTKIYNQIEKLDLEYTKNELELDYLEKLVQLEVPQSDEPVLDRPDRRGRDSPAPAGQLPEVAESSPIPPPKPARDTPPCSSCGDLKTFVGFKNLQNGRQARMLICEECSNESFV